MIELSHVNKVYSEGNRAVKDLSLTIDDGEFAFIVGRSGSGKSTLLKLLLKELEPTSGRIVVNDMDLGKMPRRSSEIPEKIRCGLSGFPSPERPYCL